MTKLERLKVERDTAKEQVERFERKYKNHNTVWHSILARVNKEIAKLEGRKKKKKKPKATEEKMKLPNQLKMVKKSETENIVEKENNNG